jgi:hypothetical protein
MKYVSAAQIREDLSAGVRPEKSSFPERQTEGSRPPQSFLAEAIAERQVRETAFHLPGEQGICRSGNWRIDGWREWVEMLTLVGAMLQCSILLAGQDLTRIILPIAARLAHVRLSILPPLQIANRYFAVHTYLWGRERNLRALAAKRGFCALRLESRRAVHAQICGGRACRLCRSAQAV